MLTPDSIVPDPTNPQSYNRYSYVNNRPTVFKDPTGHAYDAFGADSASPSCNDGAALEHCIYPENYPDQSKIGWVIPNASLEAEWEENRHTAANAAGMVPYLDTGEDVSTFLTGCGYACQAGYEEPVGWGWRLVAGIGVVGPFGVRSVRTAFGWVDEAADGVRLLSAGNWRNAEGMLGDFLGLPKNTERFFVEGMSTYRVPDFIGDGFIADSKFYGVSSLTNSAQLRDFATLAKAQDVPLYIYVREGTHVSDNALRVVEETGGQIIRIFEGP